MCFHNISEKSYVNCKSKKGASEDWIVKVDSRGCMNLESSDLGWLGIAINFQWDKLKVSKVSSYPKITFPCIHYSNLPHNVMDRQNHVA